MPFLTSAIPDWLAIGLQSLGTGLALVAILIWIDCWLYSRHVRRVIGKR